MAEIAGIRRQFIRTAMEAPFLARDEERDLAVRWKDRRDERALHRLISAHMRLVIALAGRFRHYGLPMADLVQEGHVGLMEAAARFEPEREVRFSTYATWWIRASIQDYILRNWSIVRGGTSSAQKALFFNLRRLRARLMQSTEEHVGDEIHRRIATAIGVSRDDVALMDARLSGPDMSLNAPIGEDGDTASERMDFLVDGAALPDETSGRPWTASAVSAGCSRRWVSSPSASCASFGSAASPRIKRPSKPWASGSGSRRSACGRSRTARWRSSVAPWPTASLPRPAAPTWADGRPWEDPRASPPGSPA